MKTRHILLINLVAILLVFVGCSTSSQSQIKRSELTNLVNDQNKSLPMMIDRETRLDTVMVGPENSLLFNYTLVNVKANSENMESIKETIDRGIHPLAIQNYKTSPSLAPFRSENVVLIYVYRDQLGTFLSEFKLHPEYL